MTWGPTQSLGNIIHGTAITTSTTGLVHVPYNLDSNRNQLRYLRSRNNGDTWDATRDLVADMGTFCFSCNPRQHPIVGAGADPTGRVVAITWTSRMPGGQADDDVWLLYSSNGGDTWTQPIRVNDNTNASRQFESWVAVDNYGRVHVAWTDYRNGGQNETWYARSADPTQGLRTEPAGHRRARQRQHRLPRRLQGHRRLRTGRAGGLAGHAPRQRRHLLLAGAGGRGAVTKEDRVLRRALAVVAVAAVLATVSGCRRTSVAVAADAKSQPPPPLLPEDPVLGAKATAQWREHLAFEERERKLHYDRDRMKDHRAVLKLLIGTRARYDRARSAAAVTAIKTRVPETAEAVRRRVERIDHWRVNSNLLADYDAMLNALAEAYPAARIKFIEGDRAPLLAVRAELDRRQKAIDEWLKEAAESEDE